MIAAVLSDHIREGVYTLYDQCAWYGLGYLVDTTLGLFLAIVMLGLLDRVANEWDWAHLKHSGVYVGADGWKHWISQCIAWVVILTLAKVIIYFFMWAFSQELAGLGQFLFEPLQGNIHFELVFVMILFPGVLNVIYFWIADNYLKAGAEHTGAHEPASVAEDEAKERAEAFLPQGGSDAGATLPSVQMTEKEATLV
jgi:hypothetical protein